MNEFRTTDLQLVKWKENICKHAVRKGAAATHGLEAASSLTRAVDSRQHM
jgi:hypothetical protein